MNEIKLEKFEGPLQLLLQLVEQEEMTITDIALSQVTEQFLNHLEKMEGDRLENLADFLVIATKLVYLKSKNLLPYLQPEEDEGPSLADQLKLYKQYLDASKKINDFWEANNIAYGRLEPPVRAEGFVLPANVQAADLYDSMKRLVKRLQPLRPLARMTMDRTVSVRQTIDNLRNLLERCKKINFNEILQNAENKTEVIVSFLAVLELVKDQTIYIEQESIYGELVIIKM
ncbi:segregation/condensation protein A [Patescibacteria group bacterium]|nr:segregation/condensation protein A [Patescibacteria group bacterium]